MSGDSGQLINVDGLEFDEDLTLLDGHPYTGKVQSFYDDGQIEEELNYTDGLPDGLQRSWYPSGQLEREWIAIRGQGASRSRHWHPNGVLAKERRDKNLFPIQIREWSSEGKLILDWSREWSEDGDLLNEEKIIY